jgi:hypothetical protein
MLALTAEAEPHESTGTHPTDQPELPGADVVPLRHGDPPPSARPTGAAADASAEPAAARSGVRPTAPGAPTTDAQPPRPPVLASESLREDIEPTEPWRRTLRVGGTTLAVAGAVAALALGGLDARVVVVALLLLGAGATCLLPIPYTWRAWTVLVVAGTALAVATTLRYFAGAPAEAPVLAPATVVLAAGLLFRSAYRASQLARTVVAAGMLAIALALVLADAVGEFAQVGTTWQSWLHVGSAVGFGILLLVSLLAFMAPSTTGGTMVWAVALLLWYGLHVGVTVVQRLYPAPGTGPALELPGAVAGLAAAAAASAALTAIALAQSFAAFAGGTSKRRRSS